MCPPLQPSRLLTVVLLVVAFSTAGAAQAPTDTSETDRTGYGSGYDGFEDVLDYTVPFAQEMLADEGAFGPFGIGITADGRLLPVYTWTDTYGPEEAARTAMVLRQFAETGVQLEGFPPTTLRVAGVAMDIYTQVPGREGRTDAIAVMLEAPGREPLAYVLPYVRDGDGTVTYLDPIWRSQPATIFVAPTAPPQKGK